MISMPRPSTSLIQCGKETPSDGYEARDVDRRLLCDAAAHTR